jgi:hypothetical protein
MSSESSSWTRLSIDTAAWYVLRVDGMVPEELMPRLGGLERGPGVTDRTTQLNGAFVDQGALLGVLRTLVYAGHALLSIECLGPFDDRPAPNVATGRQAPGWTEQRSY